HRFLAEQALEFFNLLHGGSKFRGRNNLFSGLRFSGPKTSIICSPMTSLKTSIKTITYLSDTGFW
ncbi:hypothetical protein, partial [Shigella flexneri]|uniref:hypothetical protein n=1 Tax=Shigella flexneri TaxID=623 RepID=UPI00209670DC